jgi:hypothetical protein
MLLPGSVAKPGIILQMTHLPSGTREDFRAGRAGVDDVYPAGLDADSGALMVLALRGLAPGESRIARVL